MMYTETVEIILHPKRASFLLVTIHELSNYYQSNYKTSTFPVGFSSRSKCHKNAEMLISQKYKKS